MVNNYLKKIAVEDVKDFEKYLFDYVESAHPDVCEAVRQKGELSKETEAELKDAVSECVEKYLAAK